MNLILISLAVLGVTGLVAAVLLYFVAQKFKVEEDPRIDEVQEALPGANCGGCGFAGCRAFAEGCVKADSLDGLLCPVGGAPTMKTIIIEIQMPFMGVLFFFWENSIMIAAITDITANIIIPLLRNRVNTASNIPNPLAI